MTIDEHINYWLESAAHDLETAENLFQSAKYDWCLFIGHLVLEKMLKALYVKTNANKIPPKIHSLVKLAELSSLQLDQNQKIFLDEVNDFNLEVRYPDFKQKFYERCTKDYAEFYFNKIKEYSQWIKSQYLLKIS
jgi:HEPN domain-containing protein